MGIDHIENLVNMSIENIKKDQPGLIESGQIKLIGKNQFGITFIPLKKVHEFIKKYVDF